MISGCLSPRNASFSSSCDFLQLVRDKAAAAIDPRPFLIDFGSQGRIDAIQKERQVFTPLLSVFHFGQQSLRHTRFFRFENPVLIQAKNAVDQHVDRFIPCPVDLFGL